MMIYGYGPKDQWRVELERASKSGLIDLIERFEFRFGFDRKEMLRLAKFARIEGRSQDAWAAALRRKADPHGEYERYLRKQKAAKRAARRRKKASR